MRRWEDEGGDHVAKSDTPGMAFAKTTRPTIGAAVERAALFRQLDGPSGRSAVWIAGPPGSGKTTLASSYVQVRQFRSIWFQVDADDADPASFFHYLGHAARRVAGAKGRDAPLPQQRDDLAAFGRKFFRQLFANAAEPLAVVLDDLHAIPAESAIYAALAAGFTQVPKHCCIIVTSRGEPPAPLARLRASGQMSCISGQELRVDADEIVLIAAHRGQIVSPEAAAKLYERTQGWAAGLVLLLEHAKISGRIVEVPTGAAPQVIFDYLAGEIFDRFEAETREFLLRVACLPRMTAAVAAALSGSPKAERMLGNLASNDYFVREFSSESGRVYQIHPLLREFLRHRAIHALPEAVGGAWSRRAAALLQGASQAEDAIALLVDARDWPEVARIAVEEADAILAQGRGDMLVAWLDLLPPTLVEASPALLRISAAARARASPRAARQLFERAYDGYRNDGDAAGMTQSCCGVIDAITDEFDDLTALDRWLETLYDLMAQAEASSAGHIDPAAATTLVRASLLRDAGNARVGHWLGLAERAVAATGTGRSTAATRADVLLARAMAGLARGDLAATDSVIEELRRNAVDVPASAALAVAVVVSLRHLIGGAYADARLAAGEALAAAHGRGVHSDDAWLGAIAVAACACGGESAAAADALQRLEADTTRLRRGDRACIQYLHSWLAALAGDAVGANRDAKSALGSAIESGTPWFECLARIALAQLQSGRADQRGAEAQIRGAMALAERLVSPWLTYAAHIAAAIVAREAHDDPAALLHIREAFRLGHEHDFRQPPGVPPQPLADLCAMALEAEVEPDFACALVRAGRIVPRAPPLLVSRWPWPFRIYASGAFECLRGDVHIELSGKGPGRPMELLKVLIALGRHNVRADQLADALWPHVEADYAYKSFTATLHRLRRALEDDGALVLRDGRLSLNKASVWVDTWALEKRFDDCDQSLRDAERAADADLRRRMVDDVLALYRGPFLADESDQPCYIAYREQLRARLLRFLSRVARGWEDAGAPEAAADCYLRSIEVDELCEPLYRQLMLCYQRNGALADAVTTYERLRTMLSTRMKSMPSPETQGLYASLRSAGTVAAAR